MFDFSLGEVQLAKPVTINIPYEPGTKAAYLRAVHWDEHRNGWQVLDGTVDESQHLIAIEVSKL